MPAAKERRTAKTGKMDPVKEIPELRVSAENIIRNVKEYAETRLNYLILDAQEKVVDSVADVITGAVIAVIGLFLLFFLSIGAAWYIGMITGKAFIGFFAVAGFYAVVGLLLFAFRKTLFHQPVTN